MKKIVLASALAAMMGGASAQMYVGAAYGVTQVDFDCTASANCDKTDTGFKIYGGYQFNPLIAAELGYIDFGKMAYGNGYGEVEASAVTFAAAFRGHFSPALAGVARLGLASVEARDSWGYPGYRSSKSETKTEAYVGLGLEYAFNKQLRGTLGADFTRGEIYGLTANLRAFNLGVQYNF